MAVDTVNLSRVAKLALPTSHASNLLLEIYTDFSSLELDPTVPKETALIKLVFHAHHTKEDIEYLVNTIGTWAVQMLALERGESKHTMIPSQRENLALRANGWK